jgi:predicted ferric reductase
MEGGARTKATVVDMVRVENNFRRVWIAGGWGLYGLMSGNRRSMRKNESVNVHIALTNVQWRLLSSKMAKNIDKKNSGGFKNVL